MLTRTAYENNTENGSSRKVLGTRDMSQNAADSDDRALPGKGKSSGSFHVVILSGRRPMGRKDRNQTIGLM